MKKYKLITWFNAIGVLQFNYLDYKGAHSVYEKAKKDNFVCAAILVNPKGKVMHIFDHTKHFEYRGGHGGDWFAPIGKNN
jgi:hypothetical protein